MRLERRLACGVARCALTSGQVKLLASAIDELYGRVATQRSRHRSGSRSHFVLRPVGWAVQIWLVKEPGSEAVSRVEPIRALLVIRDRFLSG